MQRLGQHFLKNKKVVAEIINAIALRAGAVVFEIGPGHGELTKELVIENEKTKNERDKSKIITIEKDEELCGALKKRFEDNAHMEIVCGDALKLLPLLVQKLKTSEKTAYLLAGNIPYYITGHLLRIISELENKPERCVLMIQKEVAERVAAQPPSMNRLAASVQFWAEPKIIATVPKDDFHPAPKVDSSVIALARKNDPLPCDAGHYYVAVRALFSQPRKTVLNNICASITAEKREGTKKETVAVTLAAIGIDPLSRPQNLSVKYIADIAEKFFKSGWQKTG